MGACWLGRADVPVRLGEVGGFTGSPAEWREAPSPRGGGGGGADPRDVPTWGHPPVRRSGGRPCPPKGGCLVGPEGEAEGEGAACTGGALGPDPPAVGRDDTPAKIQAHAHPRPKLLSAL